TSNMIVQSATDVVGTEHRWTDEYVRHKAVDLIGDLALLGGRLTADIVAVRPSHRGNLALASAIRRSDGLRVPPLMGIQDILGVIPHRYPMLLVDRILEVEPGKRIVGLKNVTINEPFFVGHFPGHPIMPGVLIVEAMAQAGGLLIMSEIEDISDKVVYFMSLDGVKWRKPVVPGDQLIFDVELLQLRGPICKMRGTGRVDGHTVAEATMMARIMDR
ncbi:MAG: 3-hydroxyacyl-ACP dehydratase FabZ, partial [Gemmatimonadota bacterium]